MTEKRRETCFLCGSTEPPLRYVASQPPDGVRHHKECFEDLQQKIREADVILLIDKETGEVGRILHGKAWLELIAADLEDPAMEEKVLKIPIDFKTDAFDFLAHWLLHH